MYASLLEQIYTFLLESINIPDLKIYEEKLSLVPLSNIDYRDKISGAMAGLVIKDTEQIGSVILFAESLIINQYFNPEDLANRFLRSPNLILDKDIKQFINNYRDKNLEWYNSGVASLDNSCAIRSMPAALISYGDITTLKLIGAIQSIITNTNETAIAASVLFSVALAYLLNIPAFSLQKNEDIDKFVDFLSTSIKGLETKVYTVDKNKEIVNLYIMINNILRQWIQDNVSVGEIINKWGISSNILQSLPLALYIFIKNSKSYENILEDCSKIANEGGVTTMALTLIGAYLGLNNIPELYTNKINKNKEILILSNRLFELSLTNKSNNPYRRMRDQVETEDSQDELDKLLWQAIKHNKNGEYETAIKYFEELVAKSPDYKKNEKVRLHILESYGGRGNQLLKTEEYEAALRWFKKALIYDLNNPAILCDIGITYLNIDKLDRAERYVRRAVEIAPEYEVGKEILEGIRSLRGKG